jgi:tetratricopeptide (TPR) repeat protein
MNSANATSLTHQNAFWTGRIRRRWFAIGAAGLAVCLVGWSWWWHGSASSSGRHHWKAVAKGRAYLVNRRPDLALKAVSGVRDEAPGAGEAMTVAGLALIRLGQFSSARMVLERGLKLQPNQFESAVTLAELNMDLGNGQRGVELLEMATRLRPGVFRVWLTMGKVLVDLDDHPSAIRAYEKALGLKPHDREALIGLIGSLIANHQQELAEPWVTDALQRFPDDAVVLGLAAQRAHDLLRLDESFALANRALARDPQNFHALMARARIQVTRARWKEALPDAERAVAVDPNDRGALQLLAQIETWLGLTERAAATRVKFNKAQELIALMDRLAEQIRYSPEDPALPWKMGQTALEAGSFLLAGRCFEAALALDPKFQPARESLAALRAFPSDPSRRSRSQPSP